MSERGLRGVQDLPGELLEGLALASGQVISDMEETPAIADVPLLCGVALVRDDVLRRLEDLRAGAADSARTGRRAVPEHIAATIKEVVLVGDPVTRRSQLFGCDPTCAPHVCLAQGSFGSRHSNAHPGERGRGAVGSLCPAVSDCPTLTPGAA